MWYEHLNFDKENGKVVRANIHTYVNNDVECILTGRNTKPMINCMVIYQSYYRKRMKGDAGLQETAKGT